MGLKWVDNKNRWIGGYVGDGQDIDKCYCGWQCKRWNTQGCFLGTLIEGLEVKSCPC